MRLPFQSEEPITARRPFHHERHFVITRPYGVKNTSSALLVSSRNVVIYVSTDYIVRQKVPQVCPQGNSATRVSGGGARAA